MARALNNRWMSVAVSVALGSAVGGLAGGSAVLAHAGQEASQTAPRPSQARAALNSGVDCYRRGEYELASRYFQQAEQGKDGLSGEERMELGNLLQLNSTALKARQDGAEQIRQAENAAKAGHHADAETLLHSLSTNPFLTKTDGDRAAILAEQMGLGAVVARGQEEKFVHPLLVARGKLQQARQMVAKGNYEAAEAIARETEKMEVTYNTTEDTPRKVLDDIAKVMRDPKKLLVASRVAFQSGDLDQAEKLAQAAQSAAGPTWTMSRVFGDSPSKVLKDIETVRSRLAKAGQKPAVVKTTPKAMPERPREMVTENETRISTPEKAMTANRTPVDGNRLPEAKKSAMPDAVAMLKDARDLLTAGHWQEAELRAKEAHAAGKNDWDASGDTPEKLMREIRTVQLKNERDEAVGMLVRARRLFEKGDLEAAEILAQRAEKMHSGAGQWEQGDRPAFLLAEITAAQTRRMNKVPEVVNASHTVNAETRPAAPAPVATMEAPAVTQPVQSAPVDNKTQQAQQLMAEARQLQKDGRLVEARQKAIEAQKVGATFGPGDDSPERALVQFVDAANKRIEHLQQSATDMAATAQSDNQRYQMAEGLLVEAQKLAAGFALDTHPIDAKMSWVHRTRDQALAATVTAPAHQAPAPIPTTPITTAQTAAAQPGADLLEKARQELKRGDLESARGFAVQVYNGPYGMKPQADAVLHSIDAEEFNRKIHAAHGAFDAGLEAHANKNYPQANQALRSVDVGLLPPDKQTKLKELLAAPEMQPGTVVQVPTPTMPELRTPPALPTPAPAPTSPQPAETKAPDAEYGKKVQAMQEIQFQKLRDEGLKAQREASDRFRNGETVQALEVLQDHLNVLKESNLDPDRLAMLQRPVESRLQGFKKLKAQIDYEKERTGSVHAFQTVMQREAQLEAHKKQQVEELMKKYHQFFSEGKYAEAEMAAAQAHELDPDHNAASSGMHIAKMKKNATDYNKIKTEREDMFVRNLNDAETVGPPVTSKQPIKYDDERWASIKDRKQFPKEGWSLSTKSEKELEIERKLSLPISLDFKDQKLRHVLEDLRDMTGINIVPDMPALEAEKISLDQPITMHLEGVSTKSALNLILHHAKLIYIIKDEVLLVTTEAHARGKLVARSYQILDLVIPVENHPLSTTLQQQLDKVNNTQGMQGLTTPFLGGNSLRTGANVGNPGNGPASGSPADGKNADSRLHEILIKLITTTIKPESWSDMGGPGTIEFWPLTMALVVNQTPDIQEQVAELLAALRKLQDVQVAVEVRFISLSEAFYERIGLDMNVNFMTRNTKYEPLIVSNQFQPNGFNNTFRPSNFVTGLVPGGTTPPGAFTHDLNIPLINSSFAPAIPPFGGFPNSLGLDGGLSLGLAFLSDIQVYMFMEAAQADRRTNVMQAPKLTLFNGQTSTIQINTQQFFVTQVQAFQINGQVIYAPQNNAFPLGASLAIQAVISADRRYVRLNMNPILTNLASPVTALFPITAFITPVFDNGVTGQPIPFTQYVQQPSFATINISTTVLVPDGGTVIMGGLKTLREGRNEFGPPILSKLPYVNRLFKNVGYGKETESLLIMVTPRIIINEEEEEKLGTGQGRLLPSGGEGDFIRGGFKGLQEGGAVWQK